MSDSLFRSIPLLPIIVELRFLSPGTPVNTNSSRPASCREYLSSPSTSATSAIIFPLWVAPASKPIELYIPRYSTHLSTSQISTSSFLLFVSVFNHHTSTSHRWHSISSCRPQGSLSSLLSAISGITHMAQISPILCFATVLFIFAYRVNHLTYIPSIYSPIRSE